MQQPTERLRWLLHRNSVQPLVLALGTALLAGSAGCKGDQGPQGPAGPAGSPGPAGSSCTVTEGENGQKILSCGDGTSVVLTDGQPGTPCTVRDEGNGTKTITCGDGTSVTVSDGQAGGSCTVAESADRTKTISCADGTSVTVRDGVTVATVELHVVDADSRADVIGATVKASPGDVTAVTDGSGRATLANLPAGIYQFTATAAGLDLSGSSVVAGPPRTTSLGPISLIAGVTLPLEVKLRRIDRERLNLVTLHTGGNPAYTVENCRACHNDRRGELSSDENVKPFHAMATHSSLECTFCHDSVDLSYKSGAALRKQVNVTQTCKGCHRDYPASF